VGTITLVHIAAKQTIQQYVLNMYSDNISIKNVNSETATAQLLWFQMDITRSSITRAGTQSGLYRSSLGSPDMPQNKAITVQLCYCIQICAAYICMWRHTWETY